MIKAAITGNIASGKSEVQKILEKQGYKVLDTDIVGHEILEKCDEIKSAFKDYDVFDESGKISRTKLGELVFKNKELKEKLERISHPKIKEKILEFFNKNKNEDIVFVGIPLLFEAGMEKLFDKIILVCTDDDIRKKRLIARNNFTAKEAELRIKSQIPQSQKLNKSDYIVMNDSDIESLKENTLKTLNDLKTLYPNKTF